MSGLTDTAQNLTGNVTGAVGEATSNLPGGDNASQASGNQVQQPEAPSPSAPRSLPGDLAPSTTPSSQQHNLNNLSPDEGEMVPAAGRINQNGEVTDDDGNVIGRVAAGNPEQFVGYIVTQEGDILDDDGGVVGRAEPLEDAVSSLGGAANYTTGKAGEEAEGAEEKAKAGGGIGSAFGSVANMGSQAFGLLGRGAKGVTGGVGDGVKGVADGVGDKTGLGGVTGAVGDTTKGATDAVGGTAEGATGQAGNAVEGVTGQAGDAVEGVKGVGEGVAQGDVEGAVEGVKDTAGGAVEGAQDTAGGTVEGIKGTAEGATGDVQDTAEGAVGDAPGQVGEIIEGAKDTAEGATGDVQETAEGAVDTNQLGETAEGVKSTAEGATGDVPEQFGETADGVKSTVEGVAGDVPQKTYDASAFKDSGLDVEGALDTEAAPIDMKDMAEQAALPIDELPSLSPSIADKVVAMFHGPFTVADGGKVSDKDGQILGQLAEGQDIQDLVGREIHGIDGQGNMLGENATVYGKVDIAPEGSIAERVKEQIPEAAERIDAAEQLHQRLAEAAPPSIKIPSFAPSVAEKVIDMFQGPFAIGEDGKVTDQNGKILGELKDGATDFQSLVGKEIKNIDAEGNLLGENNTVIGKVTLVPEGSIIEQIKEEVPEAGERLDAIEAKKAALEEEAAQQQLPDISILEGLKINKAGYVVDGNGNPVGRVISGDLKKLLGKMPDKEGKIWNDRGNVIGEVEVLPEAVQNESSPFEDFPDATVDKFGKVIFDGRQVGVVEGDDFAKLIGKKVDADGDILDKNGNVIGHAIRQEEEEPEEPEEEVIDYSMLQDKKVNKMGNVVDDKGQVWGRVIQGVLKNLIGKKVGENGEIFNDAGKVIGKAEPIPESEREEVREPAPFEDFPDAVVADEGKVMFNGEQVGVVVDGDAKKLKGKTVDADGDILDRAGNYLGKAERYEEPEPEPEPEIDNSALAGKRINKAGNAVDKHGDIYGRVVEGELTRLVGKMCDRNGCIRNEAGDIIGRAELIPEGEREGLKEGPFSELPGCTVNKEGEVVTPSGDVVGKLTSGDPTVLFGRAVDDDGDIIDKNGNVLGHAERWEKPEEPKEVNPMSGRKVNREGNVVDEDGDVMGRLTSGELSKCAGKKVDDDGDVVDQKGSIVGHVSLLEDIPEPEPEPEGETEEERMEREKLEQDRKLAAQMGYCIEQSLDKIKPILKMIVEKIDAEERKPEDERDEEQLVSDVRPLIEEGGKILTEANGVIRGLDPDGRIQANAKHKSATREATAEEYHLADLLKELTGSVTETIEHAKRKLEDMPKAGKKINPLWGLLSEPLFQIIAAVGLLLSGVLGLVGKLLNGLGLGNLVGNLLGGLGLNKVLAGFGLDLGDGKKKKGKSGGGLLGLGII